VRIGDLSKIMAVSQSIVKMNQLLRGAL
jgi:hypothetical protein